MTLKETDDTATMLGIVAELLRGQRHNRHTIGTATGRSLKTADRWIDAIVTAIPNARTEKDGRTKWVVVDRRDVPTKRAVAGACIAASVGSLFAGTQQARNLKDARDYLLAMRNEEYGDLDRKFFFAPKGGEFALPEQSGDFDEIVDALLTNHRVHLSYRHNDYKSEEITITPLTLVILDHQLYVVARRDDRSVRAFRFARMKEVDGTEESFEYPSALEYDPVALFRSHFGINLSSDGPIEDVEIILDEPWANYATSHRWHPSQRIERLEDGRVRVIITAYVCREIQTWALSFGEAAMVVRPDALRKTVAERLAKAAARYAQPMPLAKSGAARGRAASGGIAKARVHEPPDVDKRKA